MEKSSANSFGTFLETVTQKRSESDELDLKTLVLGALAASGSRTVGELQRALNAAPDVLDRELESLREARLVEIDDATGERVARLTEPGERVAKRTGLRPPTT
jgi:DNA-binding transcriptional ArsR family regulator